MLRAFIKKKVRWAVMASIRPEITILEEQGREIYRQSIERIRDRGRLADLLREAPLAKRRAGALIPFAQQHDKLRAAAPEAYRLWSQAYEENVKAYVGFPADSCSSTGNAVGELFRCFLVPHRRGYVLDVGCGPQPVASFLHDYPADKISGIDPIEAPHPFEFRQSFCEFLPWQDESFDTVISGTSMDHVLLLDESLSEIHRVLAPSGRFVMWLGLVPGSPRYDPSKPQLVDRFHLFHFDRPWFEQIMREHGFEIEDVFDHPAGGSNFYAFRKRVGVAAPAVMSA